MGTWGIGILEDDLSCDVYGGFVELYNEKLELMDIRAYILNRYAECIASSEDSALFWLGLAQAEWECGWLQPETAEAVKAVIAQGYDINRWPQELRQQRSDVLARFLSQIQTPPRKIRRRVKRKVPAAIFDPGTCISIALLHGGWGAAIVLDVLTTKYDTLHLVGGLQGIYSSHPLMNVFEERQWLTLTHHSFKGELHLTWCGSTQYKKDKDTWTIVEVGKTQLRPSDPTLDKQLAVGTSWGWVENQIRLQHQYEGTAR